MNETITREDVKKVLEESPELQRFYNRMKIIAELAEDAEKETGLELMADSFKVVLRMQDRLHAEMHTWYLKEHKQQFEGMEKNCREWKEIAEKLREALERERQESDNMFDNMCFLLLFDPRGAFENIILKQVERRKKIEDADGYENWQWGLRFTLMARLRMAWRLVFGKRGDINA